MIADAIDSRLANAPFNVRAAGVGKLVEPGLALTRAMYKGLWVGGRATLTPTQYHFHPNDMNRSMHEGPIDFVIPLADITDVTTRWGLVTSLVVVRAGGYEFKIRCYGARKFADRVRAAVAAARGESSDSRA
ncbi:hypothetical protein [Promicromonospora panici]|uniref:hypothetical protein n=1 Tax=Promicromonospora panici TaxID=2219658 RepID=UPI00101C0E0D|nr:hypothetical protein [Promicromonospora panici]